MFELVLLRAPARARYATIGLALVAGLSPACAFGQEKPPLPLGEAIAIAETHSARLAAQDAAATAAGEVIDRARALPDPKLRFGIENLPVTGPDAWRYDRESMTMRRIGVMQEIVNGDKRKARGERAERERDVERAMLALERANLRRDTAMAWYEVLHATRALAVLQQLVDVLALQTETVAPAIAAGRAPAAEGFAVRTALEMARDQVIEQQRVLIRARIALASLVGSAAERPPGDAPDVSRLSRPVEELLATLEEHPALAVQTRREQLAQSDVALARSTKSPDWAVELSYGQREPYYTNLISLMVSVDLPLFASSRQDRDVSASLARVEAARSLREDARRTYQAQVRGLVADWQAASLRAQRFAETLVPLARERAEAALAAYRGGRGELQAVIDARRMEAETQLGLHGALLERGRAWAGLNFLVPEEEQKP